MGNQQERSLAWLAGIIDGEGTISAQVYTLPDGRVRITPFLCVVNSDQGILDGSWEILSALCGDNKHGKPRWCKGTVPGKVSSQGYVTGRHTKMIRIDGLGIIPILNALIPHLRSTKRRSAEVLLEFFRSRENGLLLRDSRGRIQRLGYTRAEVELVSSIRSHKLAKSSEAICSAPNVLG